jgi:hypothetical protein
MLRTNTSRRLVALAGCAVLALALAAPASGKTHRLSGTQKVVDEDAGTYKMRGSLVGDWSTTSFDEVEEPSPTYFHGRGTELFKGCLDRRRDRSCKRDPKGSLSFTFDYWGLFASPDPASLVWGACWHPIVKGTGDFAGAQGVVMMVDTPTDKGVETRYIGNVTLRSHAPRRVATAGVSRSRGC